ncbi:MAG: hypothetical protein OEQ53_05555 [Saprospiraceae bacterium]|nr:hypothetical protein [Saprospiraceae bacterium]
MITNNVWEEQIWDYLDGTMTNEETERFLVKIKAQPHARKLLRECKQLHSQLHKDKAQQPSALFVENIMGKISTARHGIKVSSASWSQAGWIFAVSAIIVVSIAAFTSGDSTGSTLDGGLSDLLVAMVQTSFFRNLAWLSSSLLLLMAIDHLVMSQRSNQRSIRPV